MAITGTRVDVGSNPSGLLRDLLERERDTGQDALMTLYLNLDPRQFATPPARASEAHSLLDEASREAPHHKWQRVIEDLRERFEAENFEIDEAQSLAIVASISGDVEFFELGRPVARRVVFAEHPYLRPILETTPGAGWGVVLVNSRMGRVLLGSRDELHQVKSVRDDVTNRHDQGGWSQARYQRVVDEEIKDHVRKVARELLPLHQAGMFRRLLAGGPEEIRPLFEQALHNYVRPSFVQWIDVDVENAGVEEVHALALPVIEQHESREQEDLVQRLRAAVATDGRGAHSLDPVLSALNEQRVDTLLIAEGYRAPGVRCRSCGWLGASPGSGAEALAAEGCPVDRGELCMEPDIVECAVEAALLQSASVTTVGRNTSQPGAIHGAAGKILAVDSATERQPWLDLQGLGSVAALLRF